MVAPCLNRHTVPFLLLIFLAGGNLACGQEPTLIVSGRIINVFQSDSPAGESLVQILVQKSEVPRTGDLTAAVRFPAPGEMVYVHVAHSSKPGRGGDRNTSAQPRVNMNVRAMLRPSEALEWTPAGANWFSNIGNDSVADRMESPANPLGLETRLIAISRRRALQVTRVAPESAAAEAGIEVGDILTEANGVELDSTDELTRQTANSDGNLRLTVRDVRTGREVAVDVRWASVTRSPMPRRELGVTTEVAFYSGDAVQKVASVAAGSPADQAGIENGLLILTANGQPVPKPEDLKRAANETRGIMTLRVVDPRNPREERTLQIRLR